MCVLLIFANRLFIARPVGDHRIFPVKKAWPHTAAHMRLPGMIALTRPQMDAGILRQVNGLKRLTTIATCSPVSTDDAGHHHVVDPSEAFVFECGVPEMMDSSHIRAASLVVHGG